METMETFEIKFYKFTYSIDFSVVLLFIGTILDILSTSLFVWLNIGTEANPILRDLISISTWFIPIYLLSTYAAFVPFLSKILRKTFSYTFALVGTLLSLNNFSLVLFKNAFLVDALGFNTLVVLFIAFALGTFSYFIRKEELSKKDVVSISRRLVFFALFLGLVQAIFAVIIWIEF